MKTPSMSHGALSTESAVMSASGVWKSYENKSIQVLKGVDLQARKGESVALCGPSGCGKSTLLHLLGGLDDPDRGEIAVNGISSRSSADLLRLLRHEVGFVFQLHNLIPDLTLEENCLIPSVADRVKPREARVRLVGLARAAGLESRLNHRVQKLSGGERQRTALCRAMMNRPRILLADEPTGSLDDRTRDQVFELILSLVASEGTTLIMATHDRELAARCDRVLTMKDGIIHESP